jgi:hypothetical protein
MWWDKYIGATFGVVDVHEGTPRQYELDVSAARERGELPVDRAYIPETYVEPAE